MPKVRTLSQVTPLNPRDRVGDSAPAAIPSPVAPPPQAAPAPPAPAPAKPRGRRSLRRLLLVVAPLIVLALGLAYWLTGGRFVSTDNAYVGAEKSLITPQVSGAILNVHLVEGQRVEVGQALFDIDPASYRTALALAKGRLDAAKVVFENLRTSFLSNVDQIKMGQQAVDLRQADYDRKIALLNQHSGTRVDSDTAAAALIQARQILTFVQQQQAATLVKLGGSVDASVDSFPDYIQAKAQVEDAERNLVNTKLVAPIAGVATLVTQIQLGRFSPAGSPVFAIIADKGLWIDVNPKESDLTYIHTGLPASVSVDAFPDRQWRGNVCSIAPGTGAEFAVLPPQNASGNWVKVVQRVPLRVCFEDKEDTTNLRAGMSAYVSIDTRRSRSIARVLAYWKSWIPGLATADAAQK
jgi:membrane fusion protein, multidrug efflux system